jgi:hypothetical protein
LYTHDEILSRYKTKQDVQKTFGAPTEKKESDSSEIWLYQFGDGKVKLYHNRQTITVDSFSKFDRYLLFSFDKDNNVVRHDYTGIDLAVRKPRTGATIALIGGIVVTAVTITAIIEMESFKDALSNLKY